MYSHSRQALERELTEHNATLEELSQARAETQDELRDYVRIRTELECTIQDLEASASNSSNKAELESDLAELQATIEAKEAELDELTPTWQEAKVRQTSERRQLDEDMARMSSLYAKRGRSTKFRTKAERDEYLSTEIKSMESYEATQAASLRSLRSDVISSRRSLNEIVAQLKSKEEKIADGRKKGRELGEDTNTLKEKLAGLTEKRKEKWREDTKVESQLSHLKDDLNAAERSLAGMMDRVRLLFSDWQCWCLFRTGHWHGSSSGR